MRKVVLVNMGFDATSAISQLMAMQLTENDRAVLVSPVPTDESGKRRGEMARGAVKDALNPPRMGVLQIPCEEILLDLSDFSASSKLLFKTVSKWKRSDFDVIFELTGGTRAITNLMMFIAVTGQGLVDEVHFVDEVVCGRIVIPIGGLGKLQGKPTFASVLKAVTDSGEGGISRRELERVLNIRKSTVSRAASFLKKEGLVTESLRRLYPSDKLKSSSGLVYAIPAAYERPALLAASK